MHAQPLHDRAVGLADVVPVPLSSTTRTELLLFFERQAYRCNRKCGACFQLGCCCSTQNQLHAPQQVWPSSSRSRCAATANDRSMDFLHCTAVHRSQFYYHRSRRYSVAASALVGGEMIDIGW